jgi:hypothetical protein
MNQSGTWDFGADDPSDADDTAGFTYTIDWGDSEFSIFSGPAATSSSHAYNSPGVYLMSYTATDKDGSTSFEKTKLVTISGAKVITDPTDPSKTALFIVGTSLGDTIKVLKGTSAKGVKVVINGNSLGSNFKVTGKLIILGADGDDDISVNDAINRDSMIYGGKGNDKLKAGQGNSVLLGNLGNDTIITGVHRDVAIGGLGADTFKKSNGEDLLIAGITEYDEYTPANAIALSNLVMEWNRTGVGNSYTARVNRILGNTPGSSFVLRPSSPNKNVFDDTDIDILDGGNDKDWFLANTTGGFALDSFATASGEIATDLGLGQ